MHAGLALRKRSPSPSWLFLQRNNSHRSHLGPSPSADESVPPGATLTLTLWQFYCCRSGNKPPQRDKDNLLCSPRSGRPGASEASQILPRELV